MKSDILKFAPIFQYRIWGGEKLKTVLNKPYTESNIGESWEISGVDGFETKISEGPYAGKTLKDLTQLYKADFVGDKTYREFENTFPILIKFIDAATPLSIQVHPDDELAAKKHNSLGKNEMWYIMDSDKDSELLVGLNKSLSPEELLASMNQGNILEHINKEKVSKGDVFYIPAGRVHAIGKGITLAEIQQTSNVTYRMYDYDRVDKKTGEKRELHIEDSVDAVDFNMVDDYKTSYETTENRSNPVVDCPYFKTQYLTTTNKVDKNYPKNQSFRIFMCVSGSANILTKSNETLIVKGETILVAAHVENIKIEANKAVELLEISYE